VLVSKISGVLHVVEPHGFEIWECSGLGCRVKGSIVNVQDLRLGGFKFRVQSSEFSGFGFKSVRFGV